MSTILDSAKLFLKGVKPEKAGMGAKRTVIPMRHFPHKQMSYRTYQLWKVTASG